MSKGISVRLSLDSRHLPVGAKAAPVKIVITKDRVRSMIDADLSVRPEQWDRENEEVIGHTKRKILNEMLFEKKMEVKRIIDRLRVSGELTGLTSAKIKDRVLSELYPDLNSKTKKLTFVGHMKSFMSYKKGRTYEIYEATLNRLLEFTADMDSLTFEDINRKWLQKFDDYMASRSMSVNSRSIHLRNIRAIFNDALNDELISVYPFRRFKIKTEKTKKRALPIDKIRELLTTERVSEWERRYSDCFKLIFMLCGINIVDLFNLEKMEGDRVEYTRAKTHRPYSIKVEPEALEIIKKWEGKNKLLCYADTVKNYRSFYSRLSKYLSEFGISTYWARHSWATFAAELDIPDAVISMALGHGPENPTTDLYIHRNLKKIDSANRRVLDWVLYGKK